jgi:hypothetical protein
MSVKLLGCGPIWYKSYRKISSTKYSESGRMVWLPELADLNVRDVAVRIFTRVRDETVETRRETGKRSREGGKHT